MNSTFKREVYPNNPAQLVNAGFLVIGLVLACLIGLATIHHNSDQQVIGSEELQQTTQQLQSYSAEAQKLLEQYSAGRVTEAYANAYADTLRESTDSIIADLHDHVIDKTVKKPEQHVVQLAQQLSAGLDHTTSSPSQQTLQKLPGTFQSINDKLQHVGDAL